MSQTIDFAARVRASMKAARSSEPADVDKRARGFIMLLAGSLQQDDPQLAAELFTVLVNTSLLHMGGTSVVVSGGGQ